MPSTSSISLRLCVAAVAARAATAAPASGDNGPASGSGLMRREASAAQPSVRAEEEPSLDAAAPAKFHLESAGEEVKETFQRGASSEEARLLGLGMGPQMGPDQLPRVVLPGGDKKRLGGVELAEAAEVNTQAGETHEQDALALSTGKQDSGHKSAAKHHRMRRFGLGPQVAAEVHMRSGKQPSGVHSASKTATASIDSGAAISLVDKRRRPTTASGLEEVDEDDARESSVENLAAEQSDSESQAPAESVPGPETNALWSQTAEGESSAEADRPQTQEAIEAEQAHQEDEKSRATSTESEMEAMMAAMDADNAGKAGEAARTWQEKSQAIEKHRQLKDKIEASKPRAKETRKARKESSQKPAAEVAAAARRAAQKKVPVAAPQPPVAAAEKTKPPQQLPLPKPPAQKPPSQARRTAPAGPGGAKVSAVPPPPPRVVEEVTGKLAPKVALTTDGSNPEKMRLLSKSQQHLASQAVGQGKHTAFAAHAAAHGAHGHSHKAASKIDKEQQKLHQKVNLRHDVYSGLTYYENATTGKTITLAEALPEGWQEHQAGGKTFYYNSQTGVSQWEKPAEGRPLEQPLSTTGMPAPPVVEEGMRWRYSKRAVNVNQPIEQQRPGLRSGQYFRANEVVEALGKDSAGDWTWQKARVTRLFPDGNYGIMWGGATTTDPEQKLKSLFGSEQGEHEAIVRPDQLRPTTVKESPFSGSNSPARSEGAGGTPIYAAATGDLPGRYRGVNAHVPYYVDEVASARPGSSQRAFSQEGTPNMDAEPKSKSKPVRVRDFLVVGGGFCEHADYPGQAIGGRQCGSVDSVLTCMELCVNNPGCTAMTHVPTMKQSCWLYGVADPVPGYIAFSEGVLTPSSDQVNSDEKDAAATCYVYKPEDTSSGASMMESTEVTSSGATVAL